MNKKSTPLLFICLLILNACQPEETIQETRLRSVKYHTVANGLNGTSRTFSGLAEASDKADLSFRVAGKILSLPVKVGDHLKPGQTIATLDPSQYQLQAQQSQASLAQARAGLRNAKASFERLKGLYENNNASRHDLDSARAAADSNRAQVNAAKKALQLAQLNIAYTKLTANAACDVAEVNVSNNENVTNGQPIVKVTCGNSLDVIVSVPGNYIASIRQGMLVTVQFSIMPNQPFTAKVTEVGVAAVSGGSTFPVTVTLDEAPETIRSGLAAEVSFNFSEKEHSEGFTVPSFAVSEDTQGRFVYLVKSTDIDTIGIIHRQTVSIGEIRPDGLEILQGLKSGDKVITAGVTVINDGLKVRLNP